MQKSMTPPTNDPQAQSMQQVSMVMTLMFGFFTLQVPAGLTLYWVTSNLLQMLQQWLFTHVGLTPSVAKVSDKVTVAESAKTTTVDSKATVVPKQTTSSNKPAAKEKTGSAGKSKQK
jgi:YidC/Oxa1 family membrane protein insertase